MSLIPPQGGSSAGPIEAGDVIERTNLSIEVEKVLSDLYPLLRAVQPADLNTTLNAVATALEGRGDQLGETIETIDDYLTRFNPELPALVEDLRLTAQVSDTYADVLPEVATILRNTITTTTTLEDREEKLKALFNDVSKFSAVAERFTRANGDNLVRLGELGAAQLEVFAKYAPEYPCLLGGIVGAGKLQAEAFRGFTLHIVLETLPNQPRGYGPQDVPVYGAKNGPYCGTLPNPPFTQANPFNAQPDFADGVNSAHRQGHQPGRARLVRHRGGLRRRPRRVGPAQGAARARARRRLGRRTRPGRAARRSDGARGGGVAAMSPVLDKKTSVDLVKLLVFVVVTSLATAVLVVTIGNLSFGDSRDYKAEFTDATGVNKGDDIRVAGVRVGTVDKVEIIDRTRALVSFTVDDGAPRSTAAPTPRSATATSSASATSR